MTLDTFLADMLVLIYSSIIPFLLGVAFLVFIWNVVRYFIIGGANDESREKARMVALWAILAFVLILIFWGIVSMLVDSTGLDSGIVPGVPDYMQGGDPGGGSPGGGDPGGGSVDCEANPLHAECSVAT